MGKLNCRLGQWVFGGPKILVIISIYTLLSFIYFMNLKDHLFTNLNLYLSHIMDTKQVQHDTEFTSDTKETITNTTFADQRSSNETLGQQANLPQAPLYMPDMSWRAAQQLEKPIVIATLPWNTTDANGTSLTTISIPDIYSSVSAIDSIHTETLKMYSFYRGNPVFRFQLNGTKFHLGQLIAAWKPLRTAARIQGSEFCLTGYPHVQLSASGNDPVELKIPFIHPQSYLTTNADNVIALGELQVVVLNQLRAADASSSILNMTITLHWEKPEVQVPIYRHDIKGLPAEAAGLFDIINEVTDNVTATVSHITTGNFSGLLGDVSNLAGNAMGLISSFGGLLDKPSYLTVPQKTISPIATLGHGKGTDTSFRLGLDPGALAPKEPIDFGSTDDEMTLKHIIETPMMVGRLNWPAASPSGTRLAYFPVTPALCSYASPIYTLPFLAYMANLYQYWRGAIKYRFDFVSTSFHTGRLLIAFVPNNFTTSSPNLQQAMSCPYTIVDVQKTSRVTVEVPFVSPTPFKVNTKTDSDLTKVGYVYIFILNELVMPNNVANNIDINIYSSAGSDFEFQVPLDNIMLYENPTPPAEAVGLFENVQEGNYAPDENPIVLGTQPTHTYSKNFGESFELGDFVKRFSLINQPTITTSSSYFINRVQFLVNGTSIYAGPLAAISQLFACWTGSIRYKILAQSSTDKPALLKITAAPNSIKDDSVSVTIPKGLAAIVTNPTQDCGLEFELPPYTPYNFAVVDSYQTNTYQTEMGSFSLVGTNIDPLPADIYQSAGDDFQAFYMVCPPAVFEANNYQITI
jgi:hypothetical protein